MVKLGGAVVNAPDKLSVALDSIARSKAPVVLVHGGGSMATDLASKLGYDQTLIEGRRVTDANTLRVVTMVYAGWVNKSIVADLQARSVQAIGLSGADGDLIRSKRRSAVPVDYGFVGDPVHVRAEMIRAIFSGSLGIDVRCLVLNAITHDGAGTLLNTNADTIAADVAIALGDDTELSYVFDHQGVLADQTDPKSAYAQLSKQEIDDLIKSNGISAGMLPKVHNALRAVAEGITRVRIACYDAIDTEEGTWIS